MGKQWLGNIGKTENGVVSVSSSVGRRGGLLSFGGRALHSSHHFERGNSDPRFRTKLKIASQLVEQAVQTGVPFRAVVADSFYGEDEEFQAGFEQPWGGIRAGLEGISRLVAKGGRSALCGRRLWRPDGRTPRIRGSG